MSGQTRITVCAQQLPRLSAPIAVAGFFLDERPLRGGAGQADWRLLGFVSELLAAGRLEGRWGEAALVPTDGRLRAERLMLLGLGKRADFSPSQLAEATAVVFERCAGLGLAEIAMAPLGISAEALEGHAHPFLRGVLAGRSRGPQRVDVTLAVGDARPHRIEAALSEAARQLDAPSILVQGSSEAAEPALPEGPLTG